MCVYVSVRVNVWVRVGIGFGFKRCTSQIRIPDASQRESMGVISNCSMPGEELHGFFVFQFEDDWIDAGAFLSCV